MEESPRTTKESEQPGVKRLSSFPLRGPSTPSNQLQTNVQWHVEELTDWQNS